MPHGLLAAVLNGTARAQDENHDDQSASRQSATVLNSTVTSGTNSYSRCMSLEPIHEPVVAQGFEDRWAVWQARGDANDRATKRRLFIVAAMLISSVAILNGLRLLQ